MSANKNIWNSYILPILKLILWLLSGPAVMAVLAHFMSDFDSFGDLVSARWGVIISFGLILSLVFWVIRNVFGPDKKDQKD